MTRRPARSLLACLALVAAPLSACGGSSHKQASTATAGASTTTPSASTSTPATTKTSSAPTGTRTATTPAETTTAASGVHLPATFTVGAQGRLTPPSVTAPAGIPIALTVISADGKAHQIVLKSARRHTLSVPAGGRASTAINGLAAGQYAIQVDGTTRGTLVIGGRPGP